MIVRQGDIDKVSHEIHNDGKRIVFTNGCFDIIHAGHISYLNAAASLGDILIIGLNSDESVRRLKGPGRPVNCEKDRAVVLSSLRMVDVVVIFEEDTPLELIRQVKPDVLAKGGDYTIDTIVGAEFVTQNGGKVAVIPFIEGKSTTSIINKLRQ